MNNEEMNKETIENDTNVKEEIAIETKVVPEMDNGFEESKGESIENVEETKVSDDISKPEETKEDEVSNDQTIEEQVENSDSQNVEGIVNQETQEKNKEVKFVYLWDYKKQLELDREEKQKKNKHGMLMYATAFILVFAICIGLLVAVLVLNEPISRQSSTGNTDPAIYVAETVMPSVVLIYAADGISYGYGSGFFISSNGYIATNAHVINGKTTIRVTLSDEKTTLDAYVVGYSTTADLAVLKVGGQGYTPVKIGSSSNLKLGETVIAVGNPGGTDAKFSVTQGIVSSLNRVLTVSGNGYMEELKMIQTDCPLNPGNSGGPLCNANGEVVGIVESKLTDYESIGFCIPMDGAYAILQSIINGTFKEGSTDITSIRPTMGISCVAVKKNEKVYTDTKTNTDYYAPCDGIFVSTVTTGSGSDGVLQFGDIITKIDGVEVKEVSDVQEILYTHSIGDVIHVTFYRDSEVLTKELTLGKTGN